MDQEQRFTGQAFDVARDELPTWSLWNRFFGGKVATLTFKISTEDENVPRQAGVQRFVEVRGQRIRGTIHHGDEVEVFGKMDKDGVIRARQVHVDDTKVIVHGYRRPFPWPQIIGGSFLALCVLFGISAIALLWDNILTSGLILSISVVFAVVGILILRTRQNGGELAAKGSAVEGRWSMINTRWEPKGMSGWISILNFKIENVERTASADTDDALVELRAPRIRGYVFDKDQLEIYGEVTKDGVLDATRIVNLTTEAVVRGYRPPPPWLHFIGLPLSAVGVGTLMLSIAYLNYVLLDWNGFSDFLIMPIVLAGFVALIVGIALTLWGLILAVRRRSWRFEIGVGISLLVPVILTILLQYTIANDDYPFLACAFLLSVTLFAAGVLLVRRESGE